MVRGGLLSTWRWQPWALLGVLALTWWYYAAPIHLAKELRSAVEMPRDAATSELIAARVDFAKVDAQLSGDLQTATQGHLDSDSFSHLLLLGWLPQQRKQSNIDASMRDQHTRLFRIRYREPNRFIAIFWDPGESHEVVLTLQRKSVLHRWYVTRVYQFNVCPYDFDCALVSSPDSLSL